MKELIIGENANVIKSEGWSVRVVELDDGRWYSVTDIFRLCGYKAPEKILYRDKKSGKDLGNVQKILYPVFTKRGIRKFHMSFCDRDCLENIVKMYPCSDECRQWLMNEVVVQDDIPSTNDDSDATGLVEAVVKEKDHAANKTDAVGGLSVEALNMAVDRMLIEILELKKQLTAAIA